MSYISLLTFIFQFHSCSDLLALFLESTCFDITDLLIFLTLYHANDSIFLCISCFFGQQCDGSVDGLWDGSGISGKTCTCFVKQNICFT